MTHICKFEEDTKNYLTRFYEILEEMIKKMEEAELTDSLSHNFIVQMIPHHMAAVEMSKNLLKYNPCCPLRAIAEDIIAMQEQGIREMIPHHQGAIYMSENALRFCVCPRLQPILENIIVSQRKEVREMNRLLGC